MNVALKGHQELKRSVQGIMPETQSGSEIIQGILLLSKDFEKNKGQNFDDGTGCKEIKKNMGLQGMENRVLAGKSDYFLHQSNKKPFHITEGSIIA